MEDTSLAIHPDKQYTEISGSDHDIGDVRKLSQFEQGLTLECEKGIVKLTFYREDIVRVTMSPSITLDETKSAAVISPPLPVNLTVEENPEQIMLSTQKLRISIDKTPCRISFYDQEGTLLVREGALGMGFTNEGFVFAHKVMEKDDHYYGFGEKSGFLNKRGETYTMWNSDVYAPHNPETNSLYQSIPFFMTLNHGCAHGIFFDNTYKTHFDMSEPKDTYSFTAEGGTLNYYVMAGAAPKDVLGQYTHLTGKMPLPPKWALGYHQSRYSYQSEAEVRELVATFKKHDIPLDAVYLDIHYMKGYRVFTFDPVRFPNPEKLISDLKADGIHVVPIVDPGVKEDTEYKIYEEGITEDLFCKYLEGHAFYGDVWPGNSAFPDFANQKARDWWGEKHRFYTSLGIEGIWNDMNEPAVFNETKTMDINVRHNYDGKSITHREFHNLYGLMMGKATYEGLEKQLDNKRPFLLTRAGYAGVQRYAAVWTGDNRSFWEHLEMTIPMCLNLGLSGVPFSGPDVGGFAHDTTGELLTRWTQLGAFTPFFRNHSALDCVRQEPWSFGDSWLPMIRSAIKWRYKWLPYLYQVFREASITGVPVMRPLFMEYPDDQATYTISDQFMIGKDLLVAPVLRPGIKHRVVYLPEGNWINYWTGKTMQGTGPIIVDTPLDQMPLFIREGAILPEAPESIRADSTHERLILNFYPGSSPTHTVIYEDDGQSFDYNKNIYFEMSINCHVNGEKVNIDMAVNRKDFIPSWKTIECRIHHSEMKTITINDEDKQLIQDTQGKYTTAIVPVETILFVR